MTAAVAGRDTGPDLRYLSPLRYPGGKAKLADFIQSVVQTNGLSDGYYVEPYAGGASIALALLIGEYVSHVHINDLDPSVHAFWHVVLNQTDALCRRIRDTDLSVAEWRRQRAIRTARRPSMLDLGFATFFLNRTNRSGIIRSGGPIGGVKQTGKWGLDARFPKEALIARIQRIASYRDRITLSRDDALPLLRSLVPALPTKTLIYLDPPYYVKGGQRLYANSYGDADHAAIAGFLRGVSRLWIVSYDDVEQTQALYRGYRCRRYTLPYAAHERHQGAEVMFFSPDVKVPGDGLCGTRRLRSPIHRR